MMARGDALVEMIRVKKALTVGHRRWERRSAQVWESVHPYCTADDSIMITRLQKRAGGWVYIEEGVDALMGKTFYDGLAEVAKLDVQLLCDMLKSDDKVEVRFAERMLEIRVETKKQTHPAE